MSSSNEEIAREIWYDVLAAMPEDLFPNLVAFTKNRVMAPGYNYADEFDCGLELILQALEEKRPRS